MADDQVSRIGHALAGRYGIERQLGEGGMATVYLADDLRHRRQVALKVMHPELAATLGADRFLREVEIAARLNHPHILPMHDSGEANGFLWYVMPFVEGESLESRIEREGPLPLSEAVRLAREAADALDYAHRHGVVHRDIKPANILLNDGHALVADFGIARALHNDGSSLTRTGIAVGTPKYMSPEQATGATDVDGRTDIYALGAVLYEMIAGTPPHSGPSAQAIIAKVLTESPKDLSTTRDGVPHELAQVVMDALARDAGKRPATAGAFRDSLATLERVLLSGEVLPARRRPVSKAIWALAASIVVGAAGWGIVSLVQRGAAGAGGSGDALRLAVLPFTGQGTAEDSLFTGGIEDEVRGKLSRISGITILASTSTNQYRTSTKTPQQIARELRARYLLIGRVRMTGVGAARRVQVVSEVITGETGVTKWQETFDAAMTDVFAVQSQLASRVATALGAALATADTVQLQHRPTVNLDAWNLYLQAKKKGPDRNAIALLEAAVALDSTFAEAWGLLSSYAADRYANAGQDPLLARRSRETLERVRQLQPTSLATRMAESMYYDSVEPDLLRALAAVDSALMVAPDNPDALRKGAAMDIAAGRMDSAVARSTRARTIDPRSPGTMSQLLRLLVRSRRLAEAIGAADSLAELAPQSEAAAQIIGIAYAANGDLSGARAAMSAALARGIQPTKLAVQLAGLLETSWFLEPAELQTLFRLTPESFDNDRAWWAQSLATAHWEAGGKAIARAYADSALGPTQALIKRDPKVIQNRLLYGLMLAYVGRYQEAIAEGQWVLARVQRGRGSDSAYELQTMARIYTIAGQPEKAIATLKELLTLPWHVTPGWLRIDPAFEALRSLPGFQQLVAAP